MPGTERWIVWLSDYGYARDAMLEAIEAEATESNRATLLAQLEQAAVADHEVFSAAVVSGGGTVEQHFWVISGLAVQIPPALVPTLQGMPRVHSMVPVVPRYSADVADGTPATTGAAASVPAPIGSSTDTNNHRVAEARALIVAATNNVSASRGAGVTVAFFDTGIDEDVDAAPGLQPHPAFSVGGASRVRAHLRAGQTGPQAIDINLIWTNGSLSGFSSPPPIGATIGYRPDRHSASALHGTAMAGISVGVASQGVAEGHAPESEIVDVSISRVPPAQLSPSPFISGREHQNRWITDAASYLNGVTRLRTQLLVTATRADVLNMSFDGFSDPMHPVEVALDEMARAHDMLLVTSAGNIADETRFSNGFLNGLSVGSVRARTSPGAFVAMNETSRGPLASDQRRFYPDVCATGQGATIPNFPDSLYIAMPMVDVLTPAAIAGGGANGVPFGSPIPAGTVRLARGTSEAAAQVSGAAALYRAACLGAGSAATALETRAAILLNTIGAAPGDYLSATSGTAHEQEAFKSRNTFGVGYVRDDLLVEHGLALRIPSANAIRAERHVVRLPAASGAQFESVTYANLMPGKRYALAAAWSRSVGSPGAGLLLANCDILVESGPALVAAARAEGMSYSRLTFVAPQALVGMQTSEVQITVQLRGYNAALGAVGIEMHLREFEPDREPLVVGFQPTPVFAASGWVESLGAGASCVGASRSLEPLRVVPQAYAEAHGRSQFLLETHGSFGVHQGFGTHLVIRDTQMGGPITFGGLAFRTGRGFAGASSALGPYGVRLAETPGGPVTAAELALPPPSSPNFFSVPGIWPGGDPDWVPGSYNEFQIVVPFVGTNTIFTYSGGTNLHIWLDWSGGGLGVQGMNDQGDTNYASAYANAGPGGGLITAFGKCPVIALLPAAGPATMAPSLRVFGEPLIGASLELQVRQGDLSGLVPVVLVIGTWSPNAPPLVPGIPCDQHVVQPFYTSLGFLDQAGFARWGTSVPALAAFVHDANMAWQGVIFSPSGSALLTNAVHAHVGGGL